MHIPEIHLEVISKTEQFAICVHCMPSHCHLWVDVALAKCYCVQSTRMNRGPFVRKALDS